MKTDYEIYQEWFRWYFDGLEAPGEDEPITKFDMESIGFQSYLLRYRCNELADELVKEYLLGRAWIKNKVDFIKKYFKKFIGRQA
jgi:hypothetical protein